MLACTANGSICFVSPVYAGSISDVALTQVSEFLDTIEGKQGILIMANNFLYWTLKEKNKMSLWAEPHGGLRKICR